MTWAARREIVWPELSVYLAGGAAGLPLGVWLLFNANHMLYAQTLGVFLLAYGAYMMVRKPVVARFQPAALDFVTGFLGGIAGGAAGFPGAFVTIWCGMKGWDKARQRRGIPAVHPDHAGCDACADQPLASSRILQHRFRHARLAVHSGVAAGDDAGTVHLIDDCQIPSSRGR